MSNVTSALAACAPSSILSITAANACTAAVPTLSAAARLITKPGTALGSGTCQADARDVAALLAHRAHSTARAAVGGGAEEAPREGSAVAGGSSSDQRLVANVSGARQQASCTANAAPVETQGLTAAGACGSLPAPPPIFNETQLRSVATATSAIAASGRGSSLACRAFGGPNTATSTGGPAVGGSSFSGRPGGLLWPDRRNRVGHTPQPLAVSDRRGLAAAGGRASLLHALGLLPAAGGVGAPTALATAMAAAAAPAALPWPAACRAAFASSAHAAVARRRGEELEGGGEGRAAGTGAAGGAVSSATDTWLPEPLAAAAAGGGGGGSASGGGGSSGGPQSRALQAPAHAYVGRDGPQGLMEELAAAAAASSSPYIQQALRQLAAGGGGSGGTRAPAGAGAAAPAALKAAAPSNGGRQDSDSGAASDALLREVLAVAGSVQSRGFRAALQAVVGKEGMPKLKPKPKRVTSTGRKATEPAKAAGAAAAPATVPAAPAEAAVAPAPAPASGPASAAGALLPEAASGAEGSGASPAPKRRKRQTASTASTASAASDTAAAASHEVALAAAVGQDSPGGPGSAAGAVAGKRPRGRPKKDAPPSAARVAAAATAAEAAAERAAAAAEEAAAQQAAAERELSSSSSGNGPRPSFGSSVLSPVPPPESDPRYVSMADADALQPGNSLYVGRLVEWHAAHVDAVLAAPARTPGLPPPSLQDFQLQLNLEARCRNLAVEQYRREQEALVARGAVEGALPARRLTEAWLPRLTAALTARFNQFAALQDPAKQQRRRGSAATSTINLRKGSGSGSGGKGRSYVPLEQALKMMDSVGAGAANKSSDGTDTAAAAAGASTSTSTAAGAVSSAGGGGGSDGGAGDGGGGGGATASAWAAVAALPPVRLRELAEWVPMVKSVPPELLARAAVSGMLNSLVLRDSGVAGEGEDMPRGVALAVHVADALGRRVLDMVTYMEVCAVVHEKRRALARAKQELGAAMGKAAAAAAAGAEGGLEAAAVAGGQGGGEAGAAAAAAEDSLMMDPVVSEAAAKVRATRAELEALRAAAAALQPAAADGQLLNDGTTAEARRRAAPLKARGSGLSLEQRAAALGQRTQDQLSAVMDRIGRRVRQDELDGALFAALAGARTAAQRVDVTRAWQAALSQAADRLQQQLGAGAAEAEIAEAAKGVAAGGAKQRVRKGALEAADGDSGGGGGGGLTAAQAAELKSRHATLQVALTKAGVQLKAAEEMLAAEEAAAAAAAEEKVKASPRKAQGRPKKTAAAGSGAAATSPSAAAPVQALDLDQVMAQERDATTATASATAVDTDAAAAGDGAGLGDALQHLHRSVLRRVVAGTDRAQRPGEWDQSTRVKVGACLLDLMLRLLEVEVEAEADEAAEAEAADEEAVGGGGDSGRAGGRQRVMEPALRHSTGAAATFHHGGFQTPGLVMLHPQVLRQLEGDVALQRLLQPRFMPMVVEPRPWCGTRAGGFLSQTVPVMKTQYSPAVMERLASAHAAGRMTPLYQALTVLGNVPWRIHGRLLDVMETVQRQGGGRLGLPQNQPQELPTRFTSALNHVWRPLLGADTPAQCGTPYLRLQREGRRGGQLLVGAGRMSESEEEAYQHQCDAVRLLNRNESGLRCALKYRLDVARQYTGRYDLGAGVYQLYGTDVPTAADGAVAAAAAGGGEGGGGGGGGLLAGSAAGSGRPILFYQPHHVDFRGRAYPLHPHLHHLGDDATRGLLQFGRGRPLGERGFDWLLMQVANLWGQGVDKRPLAERLEWARQQLPAVRAAAAHPLEGGGTWWQRAEKPWQMLATCFEVADALDSSGGVNPTAFISHQPVNQDGTCNGLQHYAALGRDLRGGTAVNLVPADRPQDVYQAVADAVAERVELARAQGRSEAAKIHGHVDRKLVKQSVMTYVYGVTFVGARDQIESRLEERGWGNPKERRKVATYVAGIVFESMSDVFGPAVRVRSWLEDCAKYAVSAGAPVVWTSPLGFPVEQPYRKVPTLSVHTSLQTFSIRDNSRDAVSPLDVRKQCSGFPPNYVHCLDGAHMMMTARAVREAGACFAAVHDSYWTHAASVDLMNKAIRDTFVQLHERPLLHELRRELLRNPEYSGATAALPRVPAPGQLDLSVVRQSTYFFS